MAYNQRSENLNDKPITQQWLTQRPDAAARFEHVIDRLRPHYTGNNQGYIDRPQYRFNDKSTGGYVIVVAQVSRVLVILEPKTPGRKIFPINPETFNIDVQNLLKSLAACNPKNFDWSKTYPIPPTIEPGEPSLPDKVQMRAIGIRRGQRKFRDSLLKAYSQKCAISGCNVVELLEAAHIRPHAEKSNYAITNGLLLRADLHTLFDLGMLALNSQLRVELAPSLLNSEYKKLEGKKIQQPLHASQVPDKEALAQRYRAFFAAHYF